MVNNTFDSDSCFSSSSDDEDEKQLTDRQQARRLTERQLARRGRKFSKAKGLSRKPHHYRYSIKQKIHIVREAYEKDNNIRKTARVYRVQPKQIREWNKNMKDLKEKCLQNPRARSIHKGRDLENYELEKELHAWVLEQRQEDIPVKTDNIIAEAIRRDESGTFRSGCEKKVTRWVYLFLHRWELSIRRVTRVGQKLTGHLKKIQDDCCSAIRKRFQDGGTCSRVSYDCFLNMDQTAVYFESKSKSTVEEKGKRTVSTRDSGSNTKRCTVVVTVSATGKKLPPFFVFKGVPGKKLETRLLEQGYHCCCQPTGWFDSDTVAKKYFEQIIEPYLKDNLFDDEDAYLLVDHFKAHLSSKFKRLAEDLGMEVEYIPAGYTCVLQPVDVGFNAPFKSWIRKRHHRWCLEKYKGVKSDDKLPVPNYDDIIEWVLDAHDRVTEESIRKTWISIGLVDEERMTQQQQPTQQSIERLLQDDSDDEDGLIDTDDLILRTPV